MPNEFANTGAGLSAWFGIIGQQHGTKWTLNPRKESGMDVDTTNGAMNFTINQRLAGRWQIGGHDGICIFLGKKPRFLTRLLCRVLLEWEWVDNKS